MARKATNKSARRPRRAAARHVYVIKPKNRKLKAAGEMLARPTDPPPVVLTTKLEKALTYPHRSGAFKFLQRNPGLRRSFTYERVA